MARPFDPAEGGEPVAFGASVAAAEWVPAPAAIAPSVRSSPPPGVPTTVATIDDVAAPIDAAPATPAPPPTPAASSAPTTTDPPPPPELPVDIAIVGDSQANALAINLPTGIDTTFDIRNGSVNGCSVFDEGSVVSSRHGFHNSFERCRGWQAEWADASDGADVALVVIGAWDVFDLEHDGATITFGSPGFDRLFSTNLRSGIEAMAAGGARVGLLEVPCMRPQDVKGAGVPALPERGDDARVAHLNTLLRSIALADPARVGFVTGPKAWCGNEAIATDLDYRWDGVHVYRAGAGLIFDTIAPALLTLAAGATTAHG